MACFLNCYQLNKVTMTAEFEGPLEWQNEVKFIERFSDFKVGAAWKFSITFYSH